MVLSVCSLLALAVSQAGKAQTVAARRDPDALLALSATVDLGKDLGQNFGSLFEVRDAQGRVVAGAGFMAAYNTRFRMDRHTLQFFVRPPEGEGRFTLKRLPRPDDDGWAPAYHQVTRMLERAEAARAATPLDDRDLRGWQFVLTGGLVTTLSPYGFEQGMTGRYAYTQDAAGTCRYGLHRLEQVLAATGRSGVLTLVTKVFVGASSIYELPLPLTPGVPVTATKVGTVQPPSGVVLFTGGDARDTGVLLRTYSSVWLYPKAPAASVASALAGVPCPMPVADEAQGEAVGWLPSGKGYVTIGEGAGAKVNRVDCGP